ncbi:GNAT family N-acetyltransferase [Paludibacterium yongneupense]|uniref:GNAT family N-acetyltransferase n=1 Tax=Paludibacterium yongneupense TaxID=400061 RepID=UPI0003FB1255|nr:GNAT family N-acetyltransferase [Paludibacterium yongneupense]
MSIAIRTATRADAAQILDFITELAVYERAGHEVLARVEDIEHTLFAADAPACALMCLKDGKPIGYAVYFYSYSTWLGRNGIYLEDLYITPQHRNGGAGKKLLRHIAQQACARGCGRLEWSVLDWNEPAIQFYRSIGSQPQDEWVRYRMDGETLQRFATGPDASPRPPL